MHDIITEMRTAWEALELELLIPAKLTDEDFAAFIAARENPDCPKFLNRMPIIVAHFKAAVVEAIFNHTKDIKIPEKWPIDDILAMQWHDAYKKDTSTIVSFLLDHKFIKRSFSSLQSGHFAFPLAPELHQDTKKKNLIFIARLHDLPLWYIRGEHQRNPTEAMKNLFYQAMRDSPSAVAARDELRARDILITLPVDAVLLMMGDALHCSSPIQGGSFKSALFYNRFKDELRPGFIQRIFNGFKLEA